MTKTIKFLINFLVYHRTVVKQDHYMTHLLSYSSAILWCISCKILRYVAALLKLLRFTYAEAKKDKILKTA
jgi:hypothetical protein